MLPKITLPVLSAIILIGSSIESAHARCDHPNDLDSAGRRCGGRAASVIPGGRLGGDGKYMDSQGRQRLYGTNNDQYDKPNQGTYQKLNNPYDQRYNNNNR